MPISIKDYSWRQTENTVIVRVPLRRIPHKKVDLFHSDIYIKVHFPPFLFECFLYEPINEDGSKCTLVEGEAVFELCKTINKEWPSLQKEVTKQDMIKIKKEAIDHSQKKFAELKDKKQEKKRLRRHECIGQQMAIDDQKRNIIEGKKTNEKRLAFDEIMEWKDNNTDKNFLPSPLEKATNIINSLKGVDFKPNDQEIKEVISPSHERYDKNKNKKIGMPKLNTIHTSKEIWNKEEVNKYERSVPPLRQTGSINVGFTYRAFPTPSRESKYTEEQEWLKRQKEARRKTGFMAEDLRPEENDPIWLLEKGKSFHNAGNYLGAISAFSHALQTWNKIPELYVARSNSQLCIDNFRRVLQDTSDALDLLKPHVDSNAELRFQAHYNRGKALMEVGKPSSAVADLIEALEIHPYREDVHNLIDRAESQIEEDKAVPQDPESEGKAKREYIEPEVLAN